MNPNGKKTRGYFLIVGAAVVAVAALAFVWRSTHTGSSGGTGGVRHPKGSDAHYLFERVSVDVSRTESFAYRKDSDEFYVSIQHDIDDVTISAVKLYWVASTPDRDTSWAEGAYWFTLPHGPVEAGRKTRFIVRAARMSPNGEEWRDVPFKCEDLNVAAMAVGIETTGGLRLQAEERTLMDFVAGIRNGFEPLIYIPPEARERPNPSNRYASVMREPPAFRRP